MHIHYYIYKASRVLLPLVIIGMAAVMETACTKRVRPTYITVSDSIRHYYPVVSGEVLDLTYVVRNEGDDPFLIDDIQPSCGCIDAPKDIDAIPPHDSITLKFSFDTTKNIGYVRHKEIALLVGQLVQVIDMPVICHQTAAVIGLLLK